MKKITVIGAGNVGSTAAQRLAEKEVAEEIVLIDILEGIPQGKALDIWQSAAVEMFDTKVIGTNDYKDTANSDVIVVTAGLARKPGMSRDDLLLANAKIVASVVEQSAAVSPNSIIIVVSNPLDVMCYVALTKSGFPKNRVFGMAGVLDTSRFKNFISRELNVSVKNITTMILGGHGDSMVPLVRYTTVEGIPLSELLSQTKIDDLVKRARNGGIEIVNFLKTGSAYYAPSSSVVEMVEAIAKNTKRILPSSALLNGEYGMNNVYCGVPVKLGVNGIEEILQLKLNDDEMKAFQISANDVADNIKKLNL
ncbi:MAG: malate dehydrogenase [Chlorobiaceae bacterium]|nr:malate dehydrogenase [Chlorobiaceae bacterium]MBA4310248.1 malate dehydrogenase [Chlorobiaceae bacterium]